MSELLLKEKLRTSEDGSEARNVARTRTISVLRQLDGRRVGYVFTFLSEAGLTSLSDPIISLKGVGLSSVKWSGANLSQAKFKNAKIEKSQLTPEQIAQAIWDEEA